MAPVAVASYSGGTMRSSRPSKPSGLTRALVVGQREKGVIAKDVTGKEFSEEDSADEEEFAG